MKKIAAGTFKTNCLALMDEVQAKHEHPDHERAAKTLEDKFINLRCTCSGPTAEKAKDAVADR